MTLRRHHRKHFLAGAILAALLAGCAQQGPAASSAAPGAAAASAQVQRQALAKGLYELAYSARQNALFVASAGGFGEGADPSKVLRLDPATLAVQAEIALPSRGFGVVLDDAAGRLYVGSTTDAAIAVIDTASNKVVGTVQLAQKARDKEGRERYPHGFREMALDGANHRLYLPGLSPEGSALYVVDTRALAVEKVLPGFGTMATGVALDAARGRLFVSNLGGEVYTVDTRSLQTVKRYDGGGDQLLNLAYDAATNRLFATDQGHPIIAERRSKAQPSYQPRPGNRVLVLDADNGALIRAIPTDEGPIALKLDAPRKRLYVTNRGGGSVTVFDSESYQQLRSVALPSHPNSLAQDERRNVLYVSVKNGEKDPKGSAESVARVAF